MTDPIHMQLEVHMRRAYVAAFRIMGHPDEARDACQEAAMRALAAKDRYDPSREFYPWFYRILKNHCIDRLKKRSRAPTPLTNEPADERNVSADALRGREEREKAVARAIEQLPGELRELIELRHFQDLSYNEMALILDIPIGTVMSRLYRARKALRNTLLHAPGWDGSPHERVGP